MLEQTAVIPKPPFASTLTLEEELARFEQLKPKLAHVWDLLTARDQESYTSVVVPSLTLDQGELEKLDGASYYEERLLFLLIRLRNPRAHLVYVTSNPVHPQILDYYLNLLAGVPASHARQRLTMLCAHDSSPRSLTEKILERPRLIERIRCEIRDLDRAFVTVFNATPLERRLAVLLGIPLNGCDPELSALGDKSNGKAIFREAGVPTPAGFEHLTSESDVTDAFVELDRLRPGIHRAMVKLNRSFSGEGNAIFCYPAERSRSAIADAIATLRYVAPGENRTRYFAKYASMGGIIEEFIGAAEVTSPSVQLRNDPPGGVSVLSSHDQILDHSGQVFLGCRFPARDEYRLPLQDAAFRIGEVLARRGVVSRYGVDFIATRSAADQPWTLSALEINLRMGGTTHPFLALSFLTGGELNPATGEFLSLSGRPKCYRATDNLHSARYRGLLPEDLIEILTINRLHFDGRTESGVLFHLIGALSQYGKLGVTAIANSHAEADALYEQTLAILDAESVYR